MKIWKYMIGLTCLLCTICGCSGNNLEEVSVEVYYRKGLQEFLVEQLDLKEYDFMLEESEMNYIPNNEESKSEAQKMGDLGLKYIYLRNDLHLERLDENDVNILEDELRENRGEISEKAKDIIKDTYANVITPIEIITEEDKNSLTYYDEELSPQFVPMEALVLEIGTMEEFDVAGDYVSCEHEIEKEKQLQEYAKNMEMALDGKLGEIPIRILVEY